MYIYESAFLEAAPREEADRRQRNAHSSPPGPTACYWTYQQVTHMKAVLVINIYMMRSPLSVLLILSMNGGMVHHRELWDGIMSSAKGSNNGWCAAPFLGIYRISSWMLCRHVLVFFHAGANLMIQPPPPPESPQLLFQVFSLLFTC